VEGSKALEEAEWLQSACCNEKYYCFERDNLLKSLVLGAGLEPARGTALRDFKSKTE